MPEINLNEYLEQIDVMLEDRHYDQAAFHCRHILKQLPKNIAAYRRLGRALLVQDKWQEAGEVLRRVLSVAPDEKLAHLGLSQVYRHTQKFNQAIWHLERAWEHDPNNNTLSEELTDLYFTHRKVDNVRLQLTAGAVARQYVQNSMYDQAIALLANTLRNARDRVDLRLLLARTQREAGRRVDAAETSLNIISVLPDCLEANFILAELWLSEQRPSDAQRYLSRIEPVDPYMALKLAQGHSAPDDAIELDFGDYQTSAAKEMAEAEPDWLSTLGDSSQSEIDNAVAEILDEEDNGDDFDTLFMDDVEDEIGATEDEDSDSLLAFLSQNDSSNDDVDLDALFAEAEQDDDDMTDFLSEAADDDEDFDLDSLFDDSELDSTSQVLNNFDETAPQSTGLTGMLASLDAEEDDDFDLSDMLMDNEPSGNINAGVSADELNLDEFLVDDAEEDINLDDLFGEDTGDEDDIDFDEFFTETEEDNAPNLDDFLVEADENTSTDNAADLEDEDALPDWMQPSSDAEDPLAWMRQSGIEVVNDEAAPGRFDQTAYEADDAIDFSDPEEVDPMAWLKASGVELVDDDEEETPLTTDDAADVLEEEADPMELDPMAWLKESGIELVDDKDADSEPVNPADFLEDEPEITDDSLLDEMMAMEALTATGPLATPEDNTMTDQPDWLDDNDDETPDWLTSDEGEESFTWEDSAGDTSNWAFETEAEGDAESDDEDDDDTPDWLAGVAEGDDDQGDDFDFAAELATESDEDDDDTPDWLAGVAEGDGDQDDDFTFAAELAAESEEDDDDTPDWLAGVAEGDDDQDDDFDFAAELATESEEDDDDTPDWLSGVAEDDDEQDDDFDFAAELATESDEDDEDTPDWLAGVAEGDDEQDDDFDFAAELATESAEDDDDTPDWLSGVAEGGDEQDDDFDFAAELATESDEDEDDTPDWLAGVAEGDDDQDDDFDFAAELVTEDDDDTPDWLAGVAEGDDEQDDDFDFAAELVTEDDDDTPDWLAGVAEGDDEQDDDFDFAAELATESDVDDDDFDFAAELEEGEDAIEETPSWLADMSDTMTASTAETVDDVPDWMAFDASDDEAEEDDLAPVNEPSPALDWLSDEDEESEEGDLFAFDDDAPSWLDDVSEDDTDNIETELQTEDETDFAAELEEDEAEFDFDNAVASAEVDEEMPDWLTDASASEEETPDWLADEDEVVEEDAPDWLADADESEEVETFSWLSDLSDEDEEETPEPAIADVVEELQPLEEEPAPIAALQTLDDGDEDTLATPADNAPDWLNAMVPGFDVDYEAEEDAPIEQAFLPAQQAAAAKAGASVEFEWLNKIVEAEMYQPPEVSLETLPGTGKAAESEAATPEPSAPRTERRFVFSKPPLWQRKQAETASAGSAAAIAEDEEIGEELPDWLTDSADVEEFEFDDALLDDEDVLSSDLFDDDETDVLDNSFFAVDDEEEDDFLFDDDLFADDDKN